MSGVSKSSTVMYYEKTFVETISAMLFQLILNIPTVTLLLKIHFLPRGFIKNSHIVLSLSEFRYE